MVDKLGWKVCEGSVRDLSNDCSDDAAGARLYISAIKGTGPDDLWVLGSRADIPGARIYRYRSGDSWERISFPVESWPASDAVFPEPGRPLVATMEGIFLFEGDL